MDHGEEQSPEAQQAAALRADLEALHDDLRRLKDSLGERGSAEIRHLRDVVKQKGEEAVASTRACISERPLACVGAAFGIGVAIGALLLRR